MKTTSSTHRIKAPFVVIAAAVALALLACALPASASKSVPQRPAVAEAKPTSELDSPTPMRCPVRFCGSHRHHHGHHYTVCYGDHDHEYYCPGHD